jgi:hypothetical protein
MAGTGVNSWATDFTRALKNFDKEVFAPRARFEKCRLINLPESLLEKTFARKTFLCPCAT